MRPVGVFIRNLVYYITLFRIKKVFFRYFPNFQRICARSSRVIRSSVLRESRPMREKVSDQSEKSPARAAKDRAASC